MGKSISKLSTVISQSSDNENNQMSTVTVNDTVNEREQEAIVPVVGDSNVNEENLTINWKPPENIKEEKKVVINSNKDNNNNNNNNNNNKNNKDNQEQNGSRQNLTKSLVEYMENNPLIECPNCYSLYEYAGAGDDPNQHHLSENALEYYNKHRFRCRECDVDFCSNCKETPYHVEFTCEEFAKRKSSIKCRYCRSPVPNVTEEQLITARLNSKLSPDYCSDCEEHAKNTYVGYFPCGHPYGFHSEMRKLFARSIVYKVDSVKCIHPNCSKNITDEDLCSICYTDELAASPWMINPTCNHIFHLDCLRERFNRKWGNDPINFNFILCPICKAKITYFDPEFTKMNDFRKDLMNRITAQFLSESLTLQGCTDIERIEYGLSKLIYYICRVCQSPYFGGKRECGVDLNIREEDMICLGCKGCSKHGPDFTQYKCRFCCSPAIYFCFGHTHFCETCHQNPFQFVCGQNNQFIRGNLPQCKGKDNCPLGIDHPPNGQEFPLRCTQCDEENKNANEK